MSDTSDPAETVEVFLTAQHVIKSAAGTFSVRVYDPLGVEIAYAPLVSGAKDWADALAIFWAGLGDTVREHNVAPFN